MHSMWAKQIGDPPSELKKSLPVDRRLHYVDVQIAPHHQMQSVTSNDVNFPIVFQDCAQSGI